MIRVNDDLEYSSGQTLGFNDVLYLSNTTSSLLVAARESQVLDFRGEGFDVLEKDHSLRCSIGSKTFGAFVEQDVQYDETSRVLRCYLDEELTEERDGLVDVHVFSDYFGELKMQFGELRVEIIPSEPVLHPIFNRLNSTHLAFNVTEQPIETRVQDAICKFYTTEDSLEGHALMVESAGAQEGGIVICPLPRASSACTPL